MKASASNISLVAFDENGPEILCGEKRTAAVHWGWYWKWNWIKILLEKCVSPTNSQLKYPGLHGPDSLWTIIMEYVRSIKRAKVFHCIVLMHNFHTFFVLLHLLFWKVVWIFTFSGGREGAFNKSDRFCCSFLKYQKYKI